MEFFSPHYSCECECEFVSYAVVRCVVLCCVIFSSFGNINTKVIKIEMVDKNAKH